MSFFDRDSREGSGAAHQIAFWDCRKSRCVEDREEQKEADPEGRRRGWTISRDRLCLTVCAIEIMEFYAEDDVDKSHAMGLLPGTRAYPNVLFFCRPGFLCSASARRAPETDLASEWIFSPTPAHFGLSRMTLVEMLRDGL
jgi:hypothetical protein